MLQPVLRFLRSVALTSTCLIASLSHAQSVAMTGVMGSKALLIINGTSPKALSAGESHLGVRVLDVQGNTAAIEWQGQRQTLQIGSSPVSVGQSTPNGRKVVLRADGRGHFRDGGFINNKPIQYMVDTGATVIGIGLSDAQRIGLNHLEGTPVTLRTANGNAQGWRIRLDTVRVGGITIYGVDAVVSPLPMPYVLLGNSFLSQVRMSRQGNEMVLEQR